MRMSSFTRAKGLINLSARGVDPKKLIENTVKEIREGTAGPWHIGSSVKINQPWSGNTVEGNMVSLNQGDVVSIVQANLGEQGQDKMVLLSDGTTRAIVPLKVLGERLTEQDDPTAEGPEEFMDDADVPPPDGVIDPSEEGDSPTADDIEPDEAAGSSSPLQIQGDFIDQSQPSEAPGVQTLTGDQETQSVSYDDATGTATANLPDEDDESVAAIEMAVEAVHKKLNKMIVESKTKLERVTIQKIAKRLKESRSLGAYAEAYEKLFSKKSYGLNEMEDMFNDACDDEDEAQARKRYRRRYQDDSGLPMDDMDDQDDDALALDDMGGPGEDPLGLDDEGALADDSGMPDDMAADDVQDDNALARKRYQDAMGDISGDDDVIRNALADLSGMPSEDPNLGVQSQDDAGLPGDDLPISGVSDQDDMGIPGDDDDEMIDAQSQDDAGFPMDDEDDASDDEDEAAPVEAKPRKKYRRKYRGKYSKKMGEAKQQLKRFGRTLN